MATITVEVRSALREIALSLPARGDIKSGLREIAGAARGEWVRLAQQHLKTSAQTYVEGIQEVEEIQDGMRIKLLGVLPNMIERGWPPTDLRTTVLTSPKAHITSHGSKYLAIPFRHGTPGTTGLAGRPMPEAIYDVAKGLKGKARLGIMQPGRATMRMSDAKLMKLVRAKDILLQKKELWHSSSIYLGMQKRSVKTKSGRMQSTYTTFRTISSAVKTDPQHWLHPGIDARAFAPKVSKYIKEIAAGIFTSGR